MTSPEFIPQLRDDSPPPREHLTDRAFWLAVYHAATGFAAAVRRFKLGGDKKKCSHCGR